MVSWSILIRQSPYISGSTLCLVFSIKREFLEVTKLKVLIWIKDGYSLNSFNVYSRLKAQHDVGGGVGI